MTTQRDILTEQTCTGNQLNNITEGESSHITMINSSQLNLMCSLY